MQRLFASAVLAVVALASAAAYMAGRHESPVVISNTQPKSSVASSTSRTSVPSVPSQSPPSVLIAVPFSPQAPDANWDALHEEACEEMSLIMVHHFIEGTPLSRETAEKEVQALIAWETDHGFGYDVTVDQLGSIAEQYYGHDSRVIDDPSADDIRQLLRDGNPVIIPAAGRDLGNPYFSGAGPWYHMLVITGYGPNAFITNDPGTRRGEGYRYWPSVIMDVIHDWTGVKESIRSGKKRVLVVTGK